MSKTTCMMTACLFMVVMMAMTMMSSQVNASDTTSFSERVEQLDERLVNPAIPLINLSPQDFHLFTQRPRNYSLFVALTALKEAQRCAMCLTFQDELTLVTKSWAKASKGASGVAYFAFFEFTNGPEIFKKLNLQSAPFVFHYPPTEGPISIGRSSRVEYEVYDISRKGTGAETFARWVEVQLKGKYSLPIKRPMSTQQWATIVGSVVAVFLAIFFCYDALLFVLKQRAVWGAVTLVFILIMISGQMYNPLRGTPFQGGSASNPEYFMEGHQQQYAVETPIVAVAYPGKQRIATFTLLLLFLVAYSALLRIFRFKMRSYPFKLMF